MLNVVRESFVHNTHKEVGRQNVRFKGYRSMSGK